MFKLLSRIGVGLALALPLALVSFALVRANQPATLPPAPVAQAAEPQTCADCHAAFQTAWQMGAHGQATSDVLVQIALEKQENPSECLGCHTTGYDAATGEYKDEGVTCAACHTSVDYSHPLGPAAMSRAAEVCGACHKDTYFEWKSSDHGQSDFSCVNCHDPHSTMIKAADTSTLCANCHATRVDAYAHSAHALKGLACTDCHISTKPAAGDVSMGESQKLHTFEVNLSTCNACHESELHSPAAAMLINAAGEPPTPTPVPSLNSGLSGTVTTTPEPVGPLGYAIFTGLIGLALGIVLAPWLERGFQRLAHPKPQEVKK